MRNKIQKRTSFHGLFITGTDTGVGKTYVACGIARELVSLGFNVGVMKPAETGCRTRNGRLVPTDVVRLLHASGAKDPLSLVNPYRFRKPLAPSVAAELEGKWIRPERILKAFGELSRRHDVLIVEGAGGIMVPLTREFLFLDLAGSLGLPVLVVARPGLGTINHTLLTIAVLRSRNIPLAGIVIDYASDSQAGLAERTSPAVIERLSGVTILGTVGYGSKDFGDICDALMKQRIT